MAAKYEALCSFATIDKAVSRGSIVELDNVTAKDLLRAGYVKAVAAVEPAEEPKPAEGSVEPEETKPEEPAAPAEDVLETPAEEKPESDEE
jgi:hypothetical protein